MRIFQFVIRYLMPESAVITVTVIISQYGPYNKPFCKRMRHAERRFDRALESYGMLKRPQFDMINAERLYNKNHNDNGDRKHLECGFNLTEMRSLQRHTLFHADIAHNRNENIAGLL